METIEEEIELRSMKQKIKQIPLNRYKFLESLSLDDQRIFSDSFSQRSSYAQQSQNQISKASQNYIALSNLEYLEIKQKEIFCKYSQKSSLIEGDFKRDGKRLKKQKALTKPQKTYNLCHQENEQCTNKMNKYKTSIIKKKIFGNQSITERVYLNQKSPAFNSLSQKQKVDQSLAKNQILSNVK